LPEHFFKCFGRERPVVAFDPAQNRKMVYQDPSEAPVGRSRPLKGAGSGSGRDLVSQTLSMTGSYLQPRVSARRAAWWDRCRGEELAAVSEASRVSLGIAKREIKTKSAEEARRRTSRKGDLVRRFGGSVTGRSSRPGFLPGPPRQKGAAGCS
jgi:hypothetical protein